MAPRLRAELQRLFLPRAPVPGQGTHTPMHAHTVASTDQATDTSLGPAAWADAEGRVRVLAVALASAAGWAPLAAVWQGVQTDLDLPPPAIAVDGRGALQLWFTLAQPVAPAEARAWLAALRQRFLAELPAHRVAQWPTADGLADQGLVIDALPPQCIGPERWSAFVSADLAPVFAETPWLEIPPGDDAQASLLARLQPASAGAWREACARLMPPAEGTAAGAAAGLVGGPSAADAQRDQAAPAPSAAAADDGLAARRFLRAVMDDPSTPLPQRIEAAKALLQAGPQG